MQALTETYVTGWPFNLINGNYYLSNDVPKFYFIINFIFKSPEYFLILYLFFIIFILKSKVFFDKKFILFNYKLLLLFSILIFPNLILYVAPYPIYDGMRLFLWSLPYFCIIPAITIYYLIENFNLLSSKIYSSVVFFFGIFFLFKFFIITPYQYTYLNSFNGNIENRYQEFENDYWGSSIKELIKYSNFEKDNTVLIATCGINLAISKKYLKKKGYSNLKFVKHNNADYIIMTNRTILDNETKQITNCFDKFRGKDVFKVERGGLLLSTIRKRDN